MTATDVIKRVLQRLDSGLLATELVTVPRRGALTDEIDADQALLPRSLSKQYAEFLKRWNGIDLDVIRFYGVGAVEDGIRRLVDGPLDVQAERSTWIVLGSSPAGFVYAEDELGRVYSIDTQSFATFDQAAKRLAEDFDDFVGRFVFGSRAAEFAGDQWKRDLAAVGVLL